MPNLASLIREAERMRQAVRGAGPSLDEVEAGPREDVFPSDDTPTSSESSLSDFFPLSDSADRPLPTDPPGSTRTSVTPVIPTRFLSEPNRNTDSTVVRLTDDQLEALRSALAPPPEVMTLGEAAFYLRVGRGSLLEFVREEGLPAVKLAGKWRFKRSAMDHWLEHRLALNSRNGKS